MKINHPVEGYNGKTTVGPFTLVFEDGTAESDELNKGAKAYLKSRGYGFGSRKGKAPEAETPQPPDPRKVSRQRVGDPVRDAAVDPRKGDFLAPTNAGTANPHGTEVVNPEVHASQGVRPVKAGEVHVDDPAEQDAAEKEHTKGATDGTPVVLTEGEKADVVAAGGPGLPSGQTDPDDPDPVEPDPVEPEPDVELKGEALDKALEERGLPKTGSADEKRQRVADHDAAAKTEGQG